MFLSELNLPINHHVVVALVTDFEQISFVEEAEQRRGNEVVVLRRMMIDLKHDPGVQLIVVRQIRRDADARALPD